MELWLFIFLFFFIIWVFAFINYRVNGGFKIETSWLALALSPVIIWLLSTQQLSEFSGFGLAFKLKEVSSQPFSIKDDGDRIKPEQISSDGKEGISKIPSFITRQVSALTLQVERLRYYNNAVIREYLRRLTPYPFFKYVLFTRENGEFLGIIDAKQLLYEMKNQRMNIVKIIESGKIETIPGIRLASIISNSSKRKTLEKMNTEGLSELPVLDNDGKLIGIVERDKITSSIVAQLVSTTGK